MPRHRLRAAATEILGNVTTVTRESDGRLTPRFPFVVGLQYYGTLPAGSFGGECPGMWAP